MQEAQAVPDAGQPTLGPDGQPIVQQAPNADAEPPQAQAAPPAPAAPPADPREQSAEYWKQRFQVTQGLLNQQREQMAELRSDFNRQIADLQTQLREANSARPSAEQNDDIDLTQYYTQEQIDEYGPDQLKTIVRTSLQAARREAQAAVEQAVAPIRQEAEETKQQAAEREKLQFHAQIAEQVPDWVEVDASTEWREWLKEVDENSGMVRNDVLMSNYRARNLRFVVKMFKEFKGAQPSAPQPPLAPQGAGRAGVAPQGEQPAAVRGAPTPGEIREFYKRASLGKVSEKERTEFEGRLRAMNAA